jgi:hypothetical protein
MSLEFQSRNVPFRGRENRDTHQDEHSRACLGELVQIDSSPHDWFEGRDDPCVLLAFIDDATGKLLQLQFVDKVPAILSIFFIHPQI